MVLHLLMSFYLFLKLMPVYERLVNKSTLVFPAMHRYQQSTVSSEYSIYCRAEAIHEYSLKYRDWNPLKKSRWKLVVNRWHKMTFNQVILLTNWQLICGRTKFLRGRRKLHLFLVASLVLSDAALDCHQCSQVLELARSLQFYKQCGIVKKVHIGFS